MKKYLYLLSINRQYSSLAISKLEKENQELKNKVLKFEELQYKKIEQ